MKKEKLLKYKIVNCKVSGDDEARIFSLLIKYILNGTLKERKGAIKTIKSLFGGDVITKR